MHLNLKNPWIFLLIMNAWQFALAYWVGCFLYIGGIHPGRIEAASPMALTASWTEIGVLKYLPQAIKWAKFTKVLGDKCC